MAQVPYAPARYRDYDEREVMTLEEFYETGYDQEWVSQMINRARDYARNAHDEVRSTIEETERVDKEASNNL